MKSYFLHDGSVQSGPYSLEELEQKKISGDMLVWKEGMPDWVKAETVDDLKFLFEIQAAPPVFKQKSNLKDSQKEEPLAVPGQDQANSKKKVLIIGGIIVLLAVIGLFWFFKSRPEKEIVTPPLIALARDSVIKEEPVKKDTVKEVSMDSIASLLTFDSTNNKTKKTDTTITQGGFTMGGMSIKKDKQVASEKELKKEKKKDPKPSQQNKQDEKPVQKDKENKPQTAAIKNLIISGTFRKNLLLEAVMEGFIRNPNEQVSFNNIIVTATFMNAEGEQTGSQQFHKIGILAAGGNTSFKFKGTAPKGSKSARYSVSAKALD